MIKHFFITLFFFLPYTASAEYLMFNRSTELGFLQFVSENSIVDSNGQSIGFIKSYSFTSQKNSKLRSMIIETVVNRDPHIGSSENQIAIANKFRHDCEDVYFDDSLVRMESNVQVSYLLIFCTNHRTLGGGVIKSVKAFRGAKQMFTLSREWYVPAFRMPLEFSDFKDLAKSVFKSSELGSAWQNEYELTANYLVNFVTLCARLPGDYGRLC
jgi:hypothetical protein